MLHARGEHDGGGANARGGYADEQRGGDAPAAAPSVSEETFAEVEGDFFNTYACAYAWHIGMSKYVLLYKLPELPVMNGLMLIH